MLQIRTIEKIAALAAISLSCLATYGQTVNDGKGTIPQPTKGSKSTPFLHIEPSVPPAKNSQNWSNPPGPVHELDSKDFIDYGPYMAEMQRKIKRNWSPPPQTNHSLNAPVVVFKINKDGSISNLHLAHSCGTEDDKAALAAVEKAAPFNPLPKGSKDFIDIQYSFQSCPIFSGKSSGLFRRF